MARTTCPAVAEGLSCLEMERWLDSGPAPWEAGGPLLWAFGLGSEEGRGLVPMGQLWLRAKVSIGTLIIPPGITPGTLTFHGHDPWPPLCTLQWGPRRPRLQV